MANENYPLDDSASVANVSRLVGHQPSPQGQALSDETIEILIAWCQMHVCQPNGVHLGLAAALRELQQRRAAQGEPQTCATCRHGKDDRHEGAVYCDNPESPIRSVTRPRSVCWGCVLHEAKP